MAPAQPLKVIIIGAGIVGLATATCLAQDLAHTCAVVVLEGRDSLREVGAGIQIPPNAARVIVAMGLRRRFEEHTGAVDWLQLRRFDTGEISRRPRNVNGFSEKWDGAP